MSGYDAIGDTVTGGLLAQAVEPRTGEDRGHTHEKNCLNCGTRLVGAYCSTCGQKAHVHRSVRAFFQDFVAGVLNFEGKFWRTLPMLVWCPGLMTRRYIAGERARFISPVALYLFTVFAMFAVLNFTGALNPHNFNNSNPNIRADLQTAVSQNQQKLNDLQAERQRRASNKRDVANVDAKIATAKQDLAATQRILNGMPAISADDKDDDVPSWIRPLVESAKDHPDVLSMKIQDAASKYSWLLIPLSVPFMWLLFPFSRKYNTYDHTVFVTYSLSFMMLLVVAAGLLVAIGQTSIASFLFFVPPFHMYRQLKQSYQLSRFGAVMRTMALVTFAFIAAGLFAAATVAIGAMD